MSNRIYNRKVFCIPCAPLIVCALSPGIYADMKCQAAQSLYQAAGCCNNPNSSITTMHESTGQKIELDFSLKVSHLVVDSSAFVNGTGEMSFHTDGNLTVMIERPLFGMFTLPVTNFSRLFETPGNDTFETDGPTTILQYSSGSHVFKMTNFSIMSDDECGTSLCGYNITVAYSTKGTQAEQHKCHELGCPSNGMDALLLPPDLAIPGDSYLFIDNNKYCPPYYYSGYCPFGTGTPGNPGSFPPHEINL